MKNIEEINKKMYPKKITVHFLNFFNGDSNDHFLSQFSRKITNLL